MPHKELRWVEKASARAPRVASETWEEHKQELCNLYAIMTLRDVMISMRIRHKFTASYVFL